MSRAFSIPHPYFAKNHRDHEDSMEKLVAAFSENFSTFKEWAVDNARPGDGATLAGRLSDNYAAFRKW